MKPLDGGAGAAASYRRAWINASSLEAAPHRPRGVIWCLPCRGLTEPIAGRTLAGMKALAAILALGLMLGCSRARAQCRLDAGAPPAPTEAPRAPEPPPP